MIDSLTRARGETGVVLVVDDQDANRRLLRGILESAGHRVLEAQNGETALQMLVSSAPDTVLLDVMMPGLDGFEVCRIIKRTPELAHIPVLLVTALSDREARLTGIDSGANDILSKPIDARDVLLRVRNAVFTKRLFDQLQESYARLQELETLRENLTHMLVHDLRSPLTGAMGFIELIEMQAGAHVSDKARSYAHQVGQALELMAEMVNAILDVSRMEADRMPVHSVPCSLSHIASDATAALGTLSEERQVIVTVEEALPLVPCDGELVRRVLTNMLANAVRHSPQGCPVMVRIDRRGETVRCAVQDAGPGIPGEDQEIIFDKFAQLAPHGPHRKYSSGLGLTFCKLAVEAHSGEIGVESQLGQGSTFWFTLPLGSREASAPMADYAK